MSKKESKIDRTLRYMQLQLQASNDYIDVLERKCKVNKEEYELGYRYELGYHAGVRYCMDEILHQFKKVGGKND